MPGPGGACTGLRDGEGKSPLHSRPSSVPPHTTVLRGPPPHSPPPPAVSLLPLPAGPLGTLSTLAGHTVYPPPQPSGWALLPSLTQAAVAKVAVRQ